MSMSASVEECVVDTAENLTPRLEELPGHLQEGFETWVERHGLGRATSPEAIVARQTSFNVLLKAALYWTYEDEGADLPDFEPAEYLELVDKAAAIVDDETFRPYFLDKLVVYLSDNDIQRLWDVAERLRDSENPAETIGGIHEQLVPQEDRRKLGQFRTPPLVADLMAEWVIRESDDTVLDPGIGGGALSVNAYRAKKNCGEDCSLDEVTGVDISELSVLMGNTSLRLANGGGRPQLQCSDFLKTSPRGERVDSVICNPPYSRHHELSQDYKQRVNEQIEGEAGRTVSSLSPLYVYFYIHASEFLQDEGRMTFITPSEFLETNYGRDLKQFLLDNYHIRAFLLYDRDESVFDEAMTTSCVSFLERKSDGEDDEELTKFIRVDDWPGREDVLAAIEDGEEGDTEWGFVNTVRQRDLEPEDKWDDLFDPLEIGSDDRLVPLSAIGNVDRGIATGKNDYFCLSDAERIGSANGFDWEINEEFLSPLVRSSRSVPYYDYRGEDWEQQRQDGEEVWLLYHLDDLDWEPEQHRAEQDGLTTIDDYLEPDNGDEEDIEDLQGVIQYLEYGMTEEVGADDSYLARNRDPWYVVDRRDPAPILYTYMSRSRGRFVHNKTEARNLNNLHSVYIDAELDEEDLEALLGYLNSEFADTVVKRSGRTYSTGMDKVEPAELEDVPVIDPTVLDEGFVQRLAELFVDLCEAARCDEAEKVRSDIDRLLDEELDI